MTQRNPMNERYQTEEHTGKTRKSAASAKPVTKAASSVYISSGKKKASRGFFGRKNASAEEKKPDGTYRSNPEYIMWRRVWVGCFAVAIVALIISMVTANDETKEISNTMLVTAYVGLIVGIAIDFTKMRKLRKAGSDGHAVVGHRSKAETAAIKEEKRKQKEEAARQAEYRAKKAEEKAAKQAARQEKRAARQAAKTSSDSSK